MFPERAERLLRIEYTNDRLFAHYRDGTRLLTRGYDLDGRLHDTFAHPSTGSTDLGRVCLSSNQMYYMHSDIDQPPGIYALNLDTGQVNIWWEQHLPIPISKVLHQTRDVVSPDGTTFPISMYYAGEISTPRPTLVTAYGASGINVEPRFSVLTTVLLHAGVVCVLAHVRGGGEFGVTWHEQAKGAQKYKAVDDLLGALELLVATGVTVPHGLGLAGQSAGAVLVLAAITRRPTLVRAAVVLGPLADMVRFHLFGVASGFTGEFGTPESPNDFPSLYKLSPYHNVR